MLRNRFVAAFLALSLAPSATFGCAVGVNPKLLLKPPTVDPYGSGPLPIVSLGKNAPEMLIHVYSASSMHDGVQRVSGYRGPCRLEAFGRASMKVKAEAPVRVGDLFFIVPKAPPPSYEGWALRRATPQEEAEFQSCHWS
jgi:hypothetical protein